MRWNRCTATCACTAACADCGCSWQRLGDVVRSAPRLRLEEGMAHHPGRTRAVVTMLVAAALVGLVAIGPLLAHPGARGAALLHGTHADDLDGAKHSRACGSAFRSPAACCSSLACTADAARRGDSSWWPLAVGPADHRRTDARDRARAQRVPRGRRPLRPPTRASSRPGSGGVSAGSRRGFLTLALVVMGEDRGWAIFMITVLSLITLGGARRLRGAAPPHAPASSSSVSQASCRSSSR